MPYHFDVDALGNGRFKTVQIDQRKKLVSNWFPKM